jgi:uncharacterized protein YjbJ (UPF0337 family)
MRAQVARSSVTNVTRNTEESSMNWDSIEGNWKEFKGKLRSKWAKLTDDDLENIAGKKDVLLGRLQQHYGLKKDEAERQLDTFLNDTTPKQH